MKIVNLKLQRFFYFLTSSFQNNIGKDIILYIEIFLEILFFIDVPNIRKKYYDLHRLKIVFPILAMFLLVSSMDNLKDLFQNMHHWESIMMKYN